MNAIIEYFWNASLSDFVVGLVIAAIVLRMLIETLKGE